MNFFKRLMYFLFGMGLSLIFIILIFSKKIIACSYFPNQRILNDIKRKEIQFKCNKYIFHLKKYYDFYFIRSELLIHGKINFTESQTRRDPFSIYKIYYKKFRLEKTIIFEIENRDNTAIINNIYIKD